MKNWLIIFLCICTGVVHAQTETIAYQSILSTDGGSIINNSSIELMVEIISGSATGAIVYDELHNVTTGNNGEIDIEIGSGTPSLIPFSDIDWSVPNYVQLSVRQNSNNSFATFSTRELLSVPYALFALKVGCDNPCPGNPGPNGINGLDGPTGATGATGPIGPIGSTGVTGQAGLDGQSGADSLSPTNEIPMNPLNGQFYIDNGSNRADNAIGFRYFDGTNWIDL